ncbi:MAG: tetratricopeptide repeat protein [Usitatibacter sp.]
MRWLLVVCLGVFGYLAFTIIRPPPAGEPAVATAAAVSSSASVEDRRQAAYDLHRALKWPQAITAYDVLLREGGEEAQIRFWRGMAQWKSAHFDEALRDFQRVIELDPANLEAHRNADRLLARQKRWDEILAMWDRYIAREPRDAEAYFERGGTYFNKGEMAAALADAEKACKLGKVQACTMVERLKNR